MLEGFCFIVLEAFHAVQPSLKVLTIVYCTSGLYSLPQSGGIAGVCLYTWLTAEML